MSASALIVGEAPARTSELPLDGRSGRRLERLAGIGEGELAEWFALGNLLPAWLGNRERRTGPHSAPGDLFDAAQAREAWRSLLEGELAEFDYVLLLGGRVRAVAGLAELPWFRWVGYAGDVPPHFGFWSEEPVLLGEPIAPAFQLSAMPHPSGASHFWNDPANHARAQTFMHRLVERLVSSWFEDHLPESVKDRFRPLEPEVDLDEEERRLVQEIEAAQAQARLEDGEA